MRLSKQRGSQWTGYQVHLTETCDADLPQLVTPVETTLAPQADSDLVEPIQAELKRNDGLPAQHRVDNGDGSGTALVHSPAVDGVDWFGPARPEVSWQAQTAGAFDRSHFHIDFENRTVTGPQGPTTTPWFERTGSCGKPALPAKFPTAVCRACPVRERCTTDKPGRPVGFIPAPGLSALQAAREREQTDEFKQAYKK